MLSVFKCITYKSYIHHESSLILVYKLLGALFCIIKIVAKENVCMKAAYKMKIFF